jgi:glycine hydroxymethyltransferase
MNAPHRDDGFFTETLQSRDPEIFGAIEKELGRQRDEIELIASRTSSPPPSWPRRAR